LFSGFPYFFISIRRVYLFFSSLYLLHFYSIFTIFLSTYFSFASYTVGLNDVNAIHDLYEIHEFNLI